MENHKKLKDCLWPWIASLRPGHKSIDSECQKLGLPHPRIEGTLAEKMASSLSAIADADFVEVAHRYIASQYCTTEQRIRLEDILYEDLPIPRIPKKYRRELAVALEEMTIVADGERFLRCLEQFWNIEGDPMMNLVADVSLRPQIERHFLRNEDWSVTQLFERLGAFDAPDYRFNGFIESLVSSETCPDEQKQRSLINQMIPILKSCGVEFRETGEHEGYPVFTLAAIHSVANQRPKNLIFASSVKPDIRLRDAVNNDIEIVNHADRVLIYDWPIGTGGLTWNDLHHWWCKSTAVEFNRESKKGLYRRLRECIPVESPPQQVLYDTFHRIYKDSFESLPALLPEVWLHWDPKTVKERGVQRLLSFRMDFLMLFPHGVRVVIEVDGRQHYANDEGKADASRYAQMAASDRDLKLSGYDVYRFGAAELPAEKRELAEQTVEYFFNRLFKRYSQ